MISLEGITAVRRRIAEIEEKFGDPRQMLQGADFASNLRTEIEKMKNSAKVSGAESVQKTTATDAATAVESAKNIAKTVGAPNAVSPLPGLPQVMPQVAQSNDAERTMIMPPAFSGNQADGTLADNDEFADYYQGANGGNYGNYENFCLRTGKSVLYSL